MLVLASQAGGAEPAPAESMTTCLRPAQELVPIERVVPRFPIDGPRGGYITDGDFVVFDLTVDQQGTPGEIRLNCTTGSALLVRIAEGALRRWRFAPADAPYRGQISLTFHYAKDPASPGNPPDS